MSVALLIGDVKEPDHYAKLFEGRLAHESPKVERMEAFLFQKAEEDADTLSFECQITTCAGLETVRERLEGAVNENKTFDVLLLDQNLGKPSSLFEFLEPFLEQLEQSLIVTVGQHEGPLSSAYSSRNATFDGHWVNFKKPISIRTMHQVVRCFLNLRGRSHISNADDGTRLTLKTQLRKAERSLLRQKKHLAMVAHELRTPLNGMIGILEALLKTKSLHADQENMLQTISENADVLGMLLNEILDMSAFESEEMDFTIKLKPFRLDLLLQDVVDLQAPLLKAKQIEFKQHLKENVPHFLVGDVLRLRQVLLNLISNAIKFTDQGTVTLAVSSVTGSEPDVGKALLHFKVQDTGVGIPTADVKGLFRPFEQLDNAVGRGTGVGLGLAICKQLIQKMAGRIWVESVLGTGSIFHFEIPFEISNEAACPPVKPVSKEVEQHNHTSTAKAQPGSHVLIVEDHPTNAKVARLHLEQLGLKVTWVENGQLAVDLLKENAAFDLIIMDIQMPVLDGIEATRLIRGELGLKMPIVAMTANMLEENKGICLDVGMDDFITKPVRRATYQEITERWLKSNESQLTTESNDVSTHEEYRKVSPEMVIEQLPFDFDRAVTEFEGDADLVRSLIQAWVPQCEQDLNSIWQYIKQQNWKTVVSFAHRLKGAAGNICAEPLAQSARTLEHAAKLDGQHHDIEDLYIQLQRTFGVLLSFLQWRQLWQDKQTILD